MGAGRSGSTILGITLGNCEGFFYAGELDYWLNRSGVPSLGGLARTRFWNDVRDQVRGADDLFGDEPFRQLERSGSILRPHTWARRRRLRARYRPVTEELYRAIARNAGSDYVIDSAHYPLRAHELQQLDGIELFLVYLVRDPHSIVNSYNSTINRHAEAERELATLRTNADLTLTYLLSTLVFQRQSEDHRMFLRHEDFIADPPRVLREVLDRVGSDADIPDLSALSTGMPLRGNRLISSEVVALEARKERAGRHSPLTTVLQMPWRAVFERLRPAVGASARTEGAPARPAPQGR